MRFVIIPNRFLEFSFFLQWNFHVVLLCLNRNRHWTMVRAHDIRQNLRPFYFRQKPLAHKKIVYAPTHIPCAGILPMTPPRVVSFAFRCKMAKRIHKTGSNNVVYPLPFFFGKTMLAFIFLWVCKVVFSVRHIQIATKNNRLFCIKLFYICEEGGVPLFVTQIEPT